MRTICLLLMFVATALLSAEFAAAQSCGSNCYPAVSSWDTVQPCVSSGCSAFANYAPVATSYPSQYSSYYSPIYAQPTSYASLPVSYDYTVSTYPNGGATNISPVGGSYSVPAPSTNQIPHQVVAPQPTCSNGTCGFN